MKKQPKKLAKEKKLALAKETLERLDFAEATGGYPASEGLTRCTACSNYLPSTCC